MPEVNEVDSRRWRPIVTLALDNRLVEMRLDDERERRMAGADVVKGYRSSSMFSGTITYWMRIGGRLTAIKPVSWREIEASSAGAVKEQAA